MKLIFIYGPPAAGKLTVARKLAKLTGYKVFHNQLTVDLITSIFPLKSDEFKKFNPKFRLEIFAAAAQKNIPGIIFTYLYSGPKNHRFIKRTIKTIERYGGRVHFVHLYCHEDHLHKRVKHSSRKPFNKIKGVVHLKKVLKEHDYFQGIPFVKNLVIDNTHIPSQAVANKIKEHYKL